MTGDVVVDGLAGQQQRPARPAREIPAVRLSDIRKSFATKGRRYFRIASMTKRVPLAAMMLLDEESKWQLEDPVTKFIPELANLQVLKDDQLVPLDRR